MKVYLIRPKDSQPWVVAYRWEDVRDIIDSGDDGEEWLIKTAEGESAHFEALPEFEGW